MENEQMGRQQATTQTYQYAANLMVKENMGSDEVRTALMQQGLAEYDASVVVDDLEYQIFEAKKSQAKKDMLYGALWCVGGIGLTVAHIGFIFWGAIVFGGIQFLKGVYNASQMM